MSNDVLWCGEEEADDEHDQVGEDHLDVIPPDLVSQIVPVDVSSNWGKLDFPILNSAKT